MQDKKPNVLLIVTDQNRLDILGCYGSSLCQTPHIDNLAQEGIRYTNAYTPTAVCTPARASLFTGVLPYKHGLIRNTDALPEGSRQLPAHIPTLAEILTDNGYSCALEGKWHVGHRLPRDCGFGRGMNLPGYGNPAGSQDYQDYLQQHGFPFPKINTEGVGWTSNYTLAGTASGTAEASIPAFLANRSIERLEEFAQSDQSFFLATCFWGPHAPYLPSEPFASMYDPAAIPPWPNFADDYRDKPGIYSQYQRAFVGHAGKKRSWDECALWAARYFGCMSQMDQQIGKILQGLQQLGLAEDTLVIFTTDHGDLAGAHGGLHDKNGMMVQELYHIPLIIRVPKGQKNNQTSALMASLTDIAPTILQYCGIPAHTNGKNLLQNRPTTTEPEYQVAMTWGNHFWYDARMITDGKWKYIFHASDRDELYDLELDPWEMSNLGDTPAFADHLWRLRRQLIAWMAHNQDPIYEYANNMYGDRSQCGLHNPQPYRSENIHK